MVVFHWFCFKWGSCLQLDGCSPLILLQVCMLFVTWKLSFMGYRGRRNYISLFIELRFRFAPSNGNCRATRTVIPAGTCDLMTCVSPSVMRLSWLSGQDSINPFLYYGVPLALFNIIIIIIDNFYIACVRVRACVRVCVCVCVCVWNELLADCFNV